MRNIINILKNKSDIVFIVLLLLLGFHYNYQEIVVKPPLSVHMWRQADCASIAYNYYQNDMNFFKPEMHNLMSDDLTTGCNIGECPLINYFVAVLYKTFGFNDFWYRLVILIIYFSSLFALFKTLKLIIKSKFWSICLTLLFFASPNLVYYGNNFISDSPAFSFSLIGWYFFFKFYYQSRKKYFVYSIIFFTIAALLKVTAGMSVIAIIGLYLIELINWTKFKDEKRLFENKLFFIYPLLFFFVTVISWYLFSINYNELHKNPNYFLTSIKPIWSMTPEEIQNVIDNVLNIWHKIYFDLSALIFLLICFLLNIFYIRKANKMLSILLYSIFIGVFLFIILWFFVFRDHDYYAINLYIFPVLIVLTFFELISNRFNYLLESRIIRFFFIVFLLFNINYTKGIINERYKVVPTWYTFFNEMKTATPYFKLIGLNKEDKVIVPNDGSPNFMLYFLNVKGWSGYNNYTFDNASFKRYVDKGAKYFINFDKEEKDTSINNIYKNNKIGLFDDISIYRVDGKKTYKYPIGYSEILNSNLENLALDKNYFITNPNNNIVLSGVNCYNNELYHSGKQSIMLDGINNNYGLTYMLNVIPNTTYYASAWCYTKQGKGAIVVNDTTGTVFRKEKKNLLFNCWELLEISFTIPSNYPFDKVGVYIWNPSNQNVYFDDFRIMKLTFNKN
jgi:hypothetical protein